MRKKAVFWLGQSASRKAVAEVEDIAFNDENTEIQKNALVALANSDGGNGVEFLIRMARTHPKATIRKHAIMSLGNSDDLRAIEAIIAIAQGR